ncbi:MAG: radical SAM protein [Nannocystaceae bacterium]
MKNRLGGGGLSLLPGDANGGALELDDQEAAAWWSWPDDIDPRAFERGDELVRSGFMRPADAPRSVPPPVDLDALRPRIAGPQTRWYAENSDLHVVHDAALRPTKNPLLALGPHGSLVWRMVVEDRSIGEIRREALRIFGHDEVLGFLAQLAAEGILEPCEDLEQRPRGEASRLRTELFPPAVQSALGYAKTPWYCLWELNTACDLRCKICYLPHFKSPGVSAEQAQQIAQQLVEAGVFYVCLLGGETLLRRDLEDIVASLRREGVFVKIISNGQKLDAARLETLAAAGLNMVEVSLDGLSARTHDASRGPGAFERARSALRALRASAILRRAVVWTAHSGNHHEVQRLPELMLEHDVQECYISRFKKTGLNGSRADFSALLPAEADEIQRAIDRWRHTHPSLTVTLMPSCSCGRTSAVVGHEGTVRTCSFDYDQGLGNVLQTPFSRIWSALEPVLPAAGPVGYCTPKSQVVSLRTGNRPQSTD